MKQLIPILIFVCCIVNTYNSFAQNTSQNNDNNVLAPVQVNTQWGYIDLSGALAIDVRFDFASEFSEGLAAVLIDGRWGFVDGKGQLVVTPQFEIAYNFANGLARVRRGNQWGYINTAGRYVIKPQFDQAADFTENLASVLVGDRYGYINPQGKFVIPPQFEEAFDFCDGLALVSSNGNRQYINKRNSFVSPNSFDDAAERFSEGVALVKVGETYGYINANGAYVIPPYFQYAESFSEGLAVVGHNSAYGYIDASGEYFIPPQYEEAQHFSENLAAVKQNGQYGYINREGEWVIKAQFDKASPFIKGKAKILRDGKFAYINERGNFITELAYGWLFDFSEGLAVCEQNGLLGYINGKGQTFIPHKFEDAGSFKQVGDVQHPAQKPQIAFEQPTLPHITVEQPEFLLKAAVQSKSPMIDYFVFVNNQLHDVHALPKGTVIKPIKSYGNNYGVNIETNIVLADGLNRVYIKAINTNGTIDSDVMEITYSPPPEIVQKPDLYILSIGVSEYKHIEYNLNFADNDARDFAQLFRKQQHIPKGNRLFDNIIVETLVDAQATSSNIKRALLNMKKKVSSEDMFVLHISSHGEIDNEGNLYIRTYDTDPGIEFLTVNALSNKWLVDQIRDFDCTVVQFFDACHSGTGAYDLALKGASDVAVRELKEALRSKAIYFFASSSSQQLSQEREEWQNGAFTEAIIGCFTQKEFRNFNGQPITADSNQDGYINTSELNSYISKVVRVLTNGLQRPKATIENGEPLNVFVLE